jgi:hypothetical protein
MLATGREQQHNLHENTQNSITKLFQENKRKLVNWKKG